MTHSPTSLTLLQLRPGSGQSEGQRKQRPRELTGERPLRLIRGGLLVRVRGEQGNRMVVYKRKRMEINKTITSTNTKKTKTTVVSQRCVSKLQANKDPKS
jgi:hypothetical protein